jgi:hypothetical protein
MQDIMEPETTWELLPNSFARAVSYNIPSRRYGKTASIDAMFKVGDIVKLKTGQAPQRVVDTRWVNSLTQHEIKCEYLNSRKNISFRPETDFEHYTETTQTEEVFDMKGKLFQTLDGSVYGEGLVIDGDGKYVLKLNNGDYKAFAADQLKRVMPFTFDVVFNGMSNKRYSYLGKAGSVEVGDVLMDAKDFTIARVVAVGTESDAATKTFEGVKLKVEALA